MVEEGQEGEEFSSEEEQTTPLRSLLRAHPLNSESSPMALRHALTPAGGHFIRSHFDVPQLSPAHHRFTVGGAVGEAREWSLDEVKALGASSLTVTLECAGNGRLGQRPVPSGEPWGIGAVSTAQWSGVPLRRVLEASVLRDDVRWIVFEGADRGRVAGHRRAIAFTRALPIDVALSPSTLLAFEMNGAPIPPEHGGPLRLVVPGWYGMASVKWVARIEASTQPFDGYFQAERYVYVMDPGAPRPVERMRVKSLLVTPRDAVSGRGVHASGWAWSGHGEITEVLVSLDGGPWGKARLGKRLGEHAWRSFALALPRLPRGRHVLSSCAVDAAGHRQPERNAPNALGYGNNAIIPHVFECR